MSNVILDFPGGFSIVVDITAATDAEKQGIKDELIEAADNMKDAGAATLTFKSPGLVTFKPS